MSATASRVRAAAEHRVSAEHGADTDAERAADQVIVEPHLDAVRPAIAVQLGHAFQERIGQPPRLALRTALLGNLKERAIRCRPHVVAAQLLPDVAAQMDTVYADHRSRVGAPPGRQVRVGVAYDGYQPVSHLLLVPELVDIAGIIAAGRERDDPVPVGAQQAGRAQVAAERDGTVTRRGRDLE
jgi:hypothetical protein